MSDVEYGGMEGARVPFRIFSVSIMRLSRRSRPNASYGAGAQGGDVMKATDISGVGRISRASPESERSRKYGDEAAGWLWLNRRLCK